HRRELVKQSVVTLCEAAGLDVGIVAAGFPPSRRELVKVCSVQTLKGRMNRMEAPHLVVWDEAHHCAAAGYRAIHEALPDAVHIGLTATPERLDGTGLIEWFDELIAGPSVAELMDDGALSRYRLFAPGGPDLSDVHTVAGDYNKKELAAAMARSAVVGDAVGHYQKYAPGKRAIVFMWSVESSIQMAEQFAAAGVPTAHLDGKTDERTRDSIV